MEQYLFLILCISFVSLVLLWVDYNEKAEKQKEINNLTGDYIGYDDYVYIDWWEVKYWEPVNEN